MVLVIPFEDKKVTDLDSVLVVVIDAPVTIFVDEAIVFGIVELASVPV